MATATQTPPPVPSAPKLPDKAADVAYLAERGWRDNRDGTWSDMSPPGDITVEKRVEGPDKRIAKVFQHTVCGPAAGWPFKFAVALDMERGRNRPPVPLYVSFLSFPARRPEEQEPRARQEEFMIRDRWGEVVRSAGKFDTRADADKWIAEQQGK